MSRRLLAEFHGPEALIQAAHVLKADCRLLDAYSPIPLEELSEIFGTPDAPLRVIMAIGGFGAAACAYGLEFYSAAIDYPINSGGRPLNSWPAFMMFPFSVGILSAAVLGLLAFFIFTGLPRMHHPLFDVPGFDHVSQDRFALEIALPDATSERDVLREKLKSCGALSLHEIPE